MAQNAGSNPINLLDKGTLAAMNFNVLKRIDPETEKVCKRRLYVCSILSLWRNQTWNTGSSLCLDTRDRAGSSQATCTRTSCARAGNPSSTDYVVIPFKDGLATVQLLATAGHVTLYDFAPQEQKWARKGVEGTLFIIKRRSQPSYQYIVLNKKSQGESMAPEELKCSSIAPVLTENDPASQESVIK